MDIIQVNKTGLLSQCQSPLSIFNCFKSESDAEKKQWLSTQSFWYIWFLFLAVLAQKDVLILLEMAKDFSKFRNIEPNHIILLDIQQY